METLIELTVALPCYRSKDILWLALEGLTRQMDPPAWELLLFEEPEDAFGQPTEYLDRLKKANCQQVKYAQLSEWVPLSVKWVRLAEEAEGEGVLMHADDQFSNPYRLRETAEAFQKGADVVTQQRQYFYSMHHQRVFRYNWATQTGLHPLGANKAFKTQLIKGLRYEKQVRGVDQFMYLRAIQHAGRPLNIEWIGQHWSQGMNTNGVNRLSAHRIHLMSKNTPPYHLTDVKVDEVLPPAIAKRLKALEPQNKILEEE